MDISDTHPLLDTLNRVLEQAPDHESRVTLLVHGTWLTGTLATSRRYLDSLAGEFRRSAPDEPGTLAAGLERFAGELALAAPVQSRTTLYLVDATAMGPPPLRLGPVTVAQDSIDAFVWASLIRHRHRLAAAARAAAAAAEKPEPQDEPPADPDETGHDEESNP